MLACCVQDSVMNQLCFKQSWPTAWKYSLDGPGEIKYTDTLLHLGAGLTLINHGSIHHCLTAEKQWTFS